MALIVIDTENNGETWWAALRAKASNDPGVNAIRRHLLRSKRSIFLKEER